MLFAGEKEAVKTVLAAGREYGYGNMISYLKRDWAEILTDSGLSERSAVEATNVSAYPLRKEKCSCGERATHTAMDSEVGPDLLCAKCAEKWLDRGNVNGATVWEVSEI